MSTKVQFYHAGCPVCTTAERSVAAVLDKSIYEVEVVHLGESKNRIDEAERCGVKSVPALVIDGEAFHINHGADIAAIK